MPKTKIGKNISTVLRIFVGVLFLVSAVAKLVDIDPFVIYVFSYGFFPFSVVDVLVRLCIVAEFSLGVFIILGWYRRLVKVLTLLMLLGFSLFLCYAALRGRMESCQCFGQLVDFNPIQSLLKNAVLIILVLLAYHNSSLPTPHSSLKHILSAVIVVIVTVAVFAISLPDSWLFGESHNHYHQETLAESIAPTGVLAERHLDQGHQLVAFVTPGCEFCKMARQKISSIADRHDLDTTRIHFIEPADMGDSIFLRLTYGQRPLVLLLDDGEVVHTYHSRNISERQVTDFLR
jgi:uncharacterized membrane protein YphA (DoxX/SURF4 family)